MKTLTKTERKISKAMLKAALNNGAHSHMACLAIEMISMWEENKKADTVYTKFTALGAITGAENLQGYARGVKYTYFDFDQNDSEYKFYIATTLGMNLFEFNTNAMDFITIEALKKFCSAWRYNIYKIFPSCNENASCSKYRKTHVEFFNKIRTLLADEENFDVQKFAECSENQSANTDSENKKEVQEMKTDLTGKKSVVITDDEKEISVVYSIVEINEVVASHLVNGNDIIANSAYPAELQPRDRANRVSMHLKTLQMVNNIRPADLMASRNLNQGAPVVRKDNVVLNGNGRIMALAVAYDNGKADHYRAALIENATEFGFSANVVNRFVRPVLIRKIENPLTNDDIKSVIQAVAGGAKLGASEQAKIDATNIKFSTFSHYVENEFGDLTTGENAFFVASILQDITNSNDINAYICADGKISVDGINRAKRALLATAYNDAGMLARMTESTDDNIKQISNALVNIAPAVAILNHLISKEAAYPYKLAEYIAEAANKLSSLREEKMTVKDYLAAQSLFSDSDHSNESKAILAIFDANKRSAKNITAILKNVIKTITLQGSPNQTTLFADVKPLDLLAILQHSSKEFDCGAMNDLFATPAQEVNAESATATIAAPVEVPETAETAETVNLQQFSADNAASVETTDATPAQNTSYKSAFQQLKDSGHLIICTMPPVNNDNDAASVANSTTNDTTNAAQEVNAAETTDAAQNIPTTANNTDVIKSAFDLIERKINVTFNGVSLPEMFETLEKRGLNFETSYLILINALIYGEFKISSIKKVGKSSEKWNNASTGDNYTAHSQYWTRRNFNTIAKALKVKSPIKSNFIKIAGIDKKAVNKMLESVFNANTDLQKFNTPAQEVNTVETTNETTNAASVETTNAAKVETPVTVEINLDDYFVNPSAIDIATQAETESADNAAQIAAIDDYIIDVDAAAAVETENADNADNAAKVESLPATVETVETTNAAQEVNAVDNTNFVIQLSTALALQMVLTFIAPAKPPIFINDLPDYILNEHDDKKFEADILKTPEGQFRYAINHAELLQRQTKSLVYRFSFSLKHISDLSLAMVTDAAALQTAAELDLINNNMQNVLLDKIKSLDTANDFYKIEYDNFKNLAAAINDKLAELQKLQNQIDELAAKYPQILDKLLKNELTCRTDLLPEFKITADTYARAMSNDILDEINNLAVPVDYVQAIFAKYYLAEYAANKNRDDNPTTPQNDNPTTPKGGTPMPPSDDTTANDTDKNISANLPAVPAVDAQKFNAAQVENYLSTAPTVPLGHEERNLKGIKLELTEKVDDAQLIKIIDKVESVTNSTVIMVESFEDISGENDNATEIDDTTEAAPTDNAPATDNAVASSVETSDAVPAPVVPAAKLPLLTGSYKQIKWAVRIRAQKLSELEKTFGKDNAETIKSALVNLESAKSAAFWIDNRDHSATDIIKNNNLIAVDAAPVETLGTSDQTPAQTTGAKFESDTDYIYLGYYDDYCNNYSRYIFRVIKRTAKTVTGYTVHGYDDDIKGTKKYKIYVSEFEDKSEYICLGHYSGALVVDAKDKFNNNNDNNGGDNNNKDNTPDNTPENPTSSTPNFEIGKFSCDNCVEIIDAADDQAENFDAGEIGGSEQFYPTPAALAEKLFDMFAEKPALPILEPSAGTGDLINAFSNYRSYKDFDYNGAKRKRKIWEGCEFKYFDCVEINADRAAALKNKNLRVVWDNFLTFQPLTPYHTIIMNPPFKAGAKHLLHAINILADGGQIVAILNAETLKNPFCRERQELIKRLESGAEYRIEYVENAFDGVNVETALIYYRKPENPNNSVTFDNFKNIFEEEYNNENISADTDVTKFDSIKAIIGLYRAELKTALRVFREAQNFNALIKNSILDENILTVKFDCDETDEKEIIKRVNKKYWTKLLYSSELADLLTSEARQNYTNKINEMANYEFNERNISALKEDLAKSFNGVIDKAIMDAWHAMTYGYSMENKDNIHYYNGWKHNSAYRCNKKVILPINAYYTYTCGEKELNTWHVRDQIITLCDIERALNYLDPENTTIDYNAGDINNIIELHFNQKQQAKAIDTTYFYLDFYKKGTCHLTFKSPELLKKFNIYCGKRFNFLPNDYGTKAYSDLTPDEKAVADSFEGKESYNDTYQNQNFYLAVDAPQFQMLNAPADK